MRVARITTGVVAVLLTTQVGGAARQGTPGVQDAAWSPDGRRIAVSYWIVSGR